MYRLNIILDSVVGGGGGARVLLCYYLGVDVRYIFIALHSYLKCICTRTLFLICEREIKSIAPTFRIKGDEIILHKVYKITGSERTLEKTTAHLHCCHGIKGHYLGTISKVSSQTLYFEMHYLMNLFFSECWCNGLLNCVPFTYQKNIL